MIKKLTFPIRLKVLVTLLLIVTVVVSVITFSMAKLFHEDKQAYIKDLTSTVALSAAEESRSLLVGYRERLQAYARIMGNGNLQAGEKSTLLEQFFEDFPDLVAVSFSENGKPVASAYAMDALGEAGLSREQIEAYRAENPLPGFGPEGGVFVENSTLSAALPTLTLTVSKPSDGAERRIEAVVRLDGLLRLPARSEVFEIILADDKGVLLAHPDPERVIGRQMADAVTGGGQVQGNFGAGVAREYLRDGVEMIGGFASVEFGGVTAGALIPKSAAYLASRDLLKSLIAVALALLILATIISIMGARRLTRPMEDLSAATREIARGQFETHVAIKSSDEIGTLAGSFNQMASELRTREEALREAQAQLVQSEKMAAFGQLGAGFAHEVKNPLAGILGCAQLSMRKAEKGTPLRRNLELIEKETKRCKEIIENLLKFARQEKTMLAPIDVNPVAEDAMAIVNHQLELNQVKLERDLAENLPKVRANGNQLQQVLMNLIMNAQQAMEGEPGSVTVSTSAVEADRVEIRVRDTGPGIPQEIQKKIFEPFFTTKPGGKGTGLGLSVSFGIIRDHDGEIRIESEPGKGATFVITLPALTGEPSVGEEDASDEAGPSEPERELTHV